MLFFAAIGFLVTTLVLPNRASLRLRSKLTDVLRVDLVDAFDMVINTLVEESLIKATAVEAPKPHANDDELLRAFSAPNLRTPEFVHSKHLMLVHSAENLERALAKISNKISDCRDILKVADGEPVRRGWNVEWLPLEEYKQVILKVRALFNLAIPLIYLVRLESEAQMEFDLLLDFYYQELLDIKQRLAKVLTSTADFLQVGFSSFFHYLHDLLWPLFLVLFFSGHISSSFFISFSSWTLFPGFFLSFSSSFLFLLFFILPYFLLSFLSLISDRG